MESGAPKIELNEKPAVNQYNYTGPASRNPYFTTPGNPLREGYVAGFSNWYTSVNVASSLPGGAGAYTMNRILCATEEGAQEALRLVQEHVPDARLEQSQWGTWGGPFAADKATFDVVLPNGGRLNAGAVLNCYYHGGQGCSVYSDMNLTNSINLLKTLPS
jgi:hypothetical protein